ncbi:MULTISPECIES: aminoglycoside phosphotransferase family protein [Paenarthrobacter]|uniref:aminoglycoside phosphotransferase family protein n=1 Tax=Paenarthrobacter TaxID=1742992 RepID=UPI00074D2DEC|nr:aminoglycoside phosphotransferase family protein [Paenarthrobacter ureafaciens]AMB39950.1 aminoglycoside resistance protein [Arthrobacter sp. ATCC 21022]KUR65660.1 aminoglycoside resistance protein [Arthrobacter sp. ATCC 21022]RWW96186.1 aminoglycoside resistance protein [Paenarthrobacter ureafaciens]
MGPHAAIPIPGELHARYNRDSAGRDWLASLPGLIRGAVDRWDLQVDLGPGNQPWNGHGAVVIPVLRNSKPAALKIAYPHDEALAEPLALALWNGNGAVRLLEVDSRNCSMLLDRLDASASLQDVPVDQAREVWADVVRRLSITPDDRPEWLAMDHIAATAERWSDELPQDWALLGMPFPRWLLEAALEVCQTRGAVGRRSGKDVLVHTDLHFMNILATEDGKGYLAIDPQPQIGEAEFAVAPVLWNRLPDLPPADPETGLRERCLEFSIAAGLDPEAARQWSIAREVQNALWYAQKHGHSGDVARSLWVASTLAGKTLDGLPRAHELPVPGAARS